MPEQDTEKNSDLFIAFGRWQLRRLPKVKNAKDEGAGSESSRMSIGQLLRNGIPFLNQLLYFVIYAGLVIGVSFWAGVSTTQNKSFNWDVIGYVGSALSLTIHDATELQQLTYKEIRRATTYDTYKGLIDSNDPYRNAVATDPISFSQQLPFYSGRILYTGVLWVLKSSGINAALACKLVSTISVLLIGLLLVHWISLRVRVSLSILLVAMLAVILNAQAMAILVSSDSLSALVILLGAYLGLECKKYWPAIFTVAVSVLARPDNILIAVMIILYFRLAKFISLKHTGAALAIVFLTYACMNVMSHHYGLRTVLQQTFIGGVIRPAETAAAFTWENYSRVFAENLSGSELHVLEIFLLISLAVFFCRPRFDNPSLIPLAVIPIHYVAFPALWPRLFFAYYVLVLLLMISEMSKNLRPQYPGPFLPPWAGVACAVIGLASSAYPAILSTLSDKQILDPKLIYLDTELKTIRETGTPWNDNTAIMTKEDGVTVTFKPQSKAKILDISFDHNDKYAVQFYDGERPVSQITLESTGTIAGLERKRILLPEELTTHGFDRLRIFPLSGDGYYSIGHVILE